MKKHFFSGLIVLLPLAITYILIKFIINLITSPFENFVRNLLLNYHGTAFFTSEQLIGIVSKLLIMAFLFVLIMLVGAIGRWVVVHSLFYVTDTLLNRIPFVNKIYLACKDFTQAIFSPHSESFSRVVLVPFPSANDLSIGLVTNEFKNSFIHAPDQEFVSVLIPGTPNPTNGFLLVFKKNQVIASDMKVEQAIKYLMSCGSAPPQYMLEKLKA